MARGGKRSGAGRKKGSATRKTREIADQAALLGITPLEVMLEVMRTRYQAKDYDGACAVARDAAPYIHPRLSAVKVELPADDNADDDLLRSKLRQLAALQAAAGTDQAAASERPGEPAGNGRNGGRSVAG
jgi:hypothetical protein